MTVQRSDGDKLRRREPAALHVVFPSDIARIIPLGTSAVLGRRPDDTTPALVNGTVSRRHAQVAWDGQTRQYTIADLDSHNGTWFNGEQLTVHRGVLASGSVVRLGDVVAVFETGPGITQGETTTASDEALPGQSETMHRLRAAVARAAPDPSPALIMGETGAGKEYVAREIHRLSERSGPFLALNCAELSSQLIESQLFGHERGAFTGAVSAGEGLFRAANRGTLFLDEIGELPLSQQPKLLRVLQESEVRPVGGTRSFKVDVRVVAATNRDLPSLVAEEQFRRDLYARLALWEVNIPAVRQRRADILHWVDVIHTQWCAERNRPSTTLVFDADAVQAILLHSWPDNLRGINKLVHRVGAADRPLIGLDLVREIIGDPAAHSSSGLTASITDSSEPMEATSKLPAPTREELVAVMAQFDGSIRAVAKHYGRDRRQIYRWMDKYDLREGT